VKRPCAKRAPKPLIIRHCKNNHHLNLRGLPEAAWYHSFLSFESAQLAPDIGTIPDSARRRHLVTHRTNGRKDIFHEEPVAQPVACLTIQYHPRATATPHGRLQADRVPQASAKRPLRFSNPSSTRNSRSMEKSHERYSREPR
jgi:hypothetical protein